MPVSRHYRLPRADLSLTALGLGTAPMGGFGGVTTAVEARATVAAAWALGVRYYDTAPYYGYGRSEHLVGESLRDMPRSDYILSTKVGRLMLPHAHNTPRDVADARGWVNALPFQQHFDYTGGGIERSLEDSLQRLGTDRLEIALIHDIGSYTHGDKAAHYWKQLTSGGGLAALERLRAAGVITAVGVGANEWPVIADVMEHMDLDVSLLAGRYTLLEQKSVDFMDRCAARGHAIVIGGPFNSGILAGGDTFDYAKASPAVVAHVAALRAVCQEFEVNIMAAALQFPFAHRAVVSTIPGARSVAEVRSNAGLLSQSIPPAFWAALHQRGLLAEHTPVPV